MDVELASEFMYSDPVIDEKTLVIAVSQSGETIDTLEALKYAKRQGAKCLSVINVKGSSIARESDYVLYTAAGPEIAVASTKAYTTQLSVFYLVVAKMALLRGVYTEEQTKSFIAELERVPEVMQKVLEKRRDIHVIAKKILEAKDLFMIGRGDVYKRQAEELREVANKSLTQTLSRSINTSITTFIMVVMLYILGVASIRDFSLPLMAGLVCGAYSSICIATELWYVMKVHLGKNKATK